jgi:glycosyltransferase involved in cell wall biosynthesis
MQIVKQRVIRVLHVIYTMNVGGIEKWLVEILRQIDRDRLEMDFLVHVLHPSPLSEQIQSLGSQIILCPHPQKYTFQPWLYNLTFKKILRDYGPYDVIHSHMAHFNGYILRLAKQIGVTIRIAHSHNDNTSIEQTEKFNRRLYINWTKRWISQYATLGLGVSRQATAYMFGSAWEADSRWQVLHCSLDLNPFQESINSANLRAELGIPQDALIIGHVGRFTQQKNPLFVVEIAAEVAKLHQNMRLLLVGDGEMFPEIKLKVAQLGLTNHVVFTGMRADVPRLMLGAMDVFLFPSFYEGLGLALIEAQAAGLPCVFADVIPEEADIVKPLLHRISLSQSATVWAKAVIKSLGLASSITNADALAAVKNSYFNIQLGIKKLTEIYESNFFNQLT